MNLRFYLFVSGVIKRMEREKVSSRFPCVIPGVWELSLGFIASKVVVFSDCGVFVDD